MQENQKAQTQQDVFAIGQLFTFVPGQPVTCNGYPGTVKRMYSEGMVEVRVPGGLVCVSASYPDCYPNQSLAREQSPCWSKEHSDAAVREGWDIWDTASGSMGHWQVQRIDDPEGFAEDAGFVPPALKSDDDAMQIVANGTRPHHVAARLFLLANNRAEYDAMMAFSDLKLPQQVTFDEFAALATLKELANHGRKAEVFYAGASQGFVDALGTDGLRQAHRAAVNNALYANSPGAPDFLARPLPEAHVLAEYPEMVKLFPEASALVRGQGSNNPEPDHEAPVLFEIDAEQGEATGKVIPCCSARCQTAYREANANASSKLVEGTSTLASFGVDPQCEHCGDDIRDAMTRQCAQEVLDGIGRIAAVNGHCSVDDGVVTLPDGSTVDLRYALATQKPRGENSLDWTVRVELSVTADSPEEAAKRALEDIRDVTLEEINVEVENIGSGRLTAVSVKNS